MKSTLLRSAIEKMTINIFVLIKTIDKNTEMTYDNHGIVDHDHNHQEQWPKQ